ncbi:MAG: GtrA family protein [Geobacteraceae bacterium]|nr:GtrA family protein [Geobacteraceae bacterium]
MTASVIGTGAHYVLMLGLVGLTNIDEVYASTCGAIVGAVIIYVLNYYVTFKSTERHHSSAPKFAIVALFGIALNGLLIKLLMTCFDCHYLFLQVLTTAMVFCLNYLLSRIWIFWAKKYCCNAWRPKWLRTEGIHGTNGTDKSHGD